MLGRLLSRRRAAERAEPAEQAVNDGLPVEVALIIEAMSFWDRGIRDVETGEHRVIGMTADGRSAFEATREGSEGWLRKRWPSLDEHQVSAGRDLLHARMISYMRNVAATTSPAQRDGWATWKPLRSV